jgi:hypothetical protein
MDLGCHGLVPWRLTLLAQPHVQLTESTKRETPRRNAMASRRVLQHFCSCERESRRRKAVASQSYSFLWHSFPRSDAGAYSLDFVKPLNLGVHHEVQEFYDVISNLTAIDNVVEHAMIE